MRGPYTGTVHVHLAAADGRGRERSGLEEADIEQPAVDPGCSGAAFRIIHQDTCRPARTTVRQGLKPLQ
jgi:hypothetical protein